MTKPMEKKSIPKELTETEIENADLDLASRSLEDLAQEQLSFYDLILVKKISHQICRNGLALEEACLLLDIPLEIFKEKMELYSIIPRIIRMKELQYKKELMRVLSAKARSGDDKLAQWLLERKYPDEFYVSKRVGKGDQNDDEDILFQAIEFIQTHGDNSPLVKTTSARAIVIKKSSNLIRQVKDILK